MDEMPLELSPTPKRVFALSNTKLLASAVSVEPSENGIASDDKPVVIPSTLSMFISSSLKLTSVPAVAFVSSEKSNVLTVE